MNTTTKYNQFDDGDWDDCLSPDEYEEVLDRKRFNQSMGRNAWYNIRTNTHKKGQKW